MMRCPQSKNAPPSRGLGSDMLVKVIVIFLTVMAMIGMIGKLLFPDRLPRLNGQRCKSCGKPRIGRASCACGGRA